ncbi:MAG TPA: glycosyltransferase, partial [Planctomycetota bacterium]|nr:glycosyltransferase [Planctomycetota bacterium]
NPPLADYENPIAGRLFARHLAAGGFDLVHVFHARNVGTDAIAAPRALGVPVVVNLMDFWFLCPNFMLLRRNGDLCQGPPEGGLGCVPCMDPALAATVAGAGTAQQLRAVGEGNDVLAGMRRTPAAYAHALIARKARLFAALARADAIVAPSRFLQRMFEDAGFPRGRITHVAYGVDESRLANARGEREPRAPGAPLRIGYVGSITPHKGLHVLVRALRRVPGDGWRLAVHGALETHPEYTARIRRLAGTDSRIRFHGSFAPDALGVVLRSLDVVVVPSLWYENTPFSILEALAAGVPVVASDLGGISEVVEHGGNGWLFAAGDRAALTGRLAALVADPAQLDALRPAPLRSLTANVDDFAAIYRRLLGSRAAVR